jgi:adenylate kinase
VRLLLLAPPGAGKGTQGERLAARHGVRHIAAGDLLRAEAQAATPAGREIAAYQDRGDLVPDQIVLSALTPAVVEAAAGGGYILDGFPRTLPQATAAAELAARLGVTLDAAVYLYAPEEVLTRRLLDRASQGGRADDVADVIRHRLRVFAETTGPLVPYYTERGSGGRRPATRFRHRRHPGPAVRTAAGPPAWSRRRRTHMSHRAESPDRWSLDVAISKRCR